MESRSGKQRIFSGIQPSGKLHIGNYVGALSQWVATQDMYESIFCVVDLHALTLPKTIRPGRLRYKSREVAALYVACGIDPDRSAIFIQSHIKEHAELAWILNCVTPVGWLARMTQYKTKARQTATIGAGLLDYPVLQAADILLYQTNLVPVGEDQVQHIEFTRDVAARFNHRFGTAFTIPRVQIREIGARIMGLDEPETKMSKSIGETRSRHTIGLLDDPEKVRRAIMSAVTDSRSDMHFASASPGVLNLLTLYQALSSQERSAIEATFEGKTYGDLKRETVDLVLATLQPIQVRYRQIMNDRQYIERVLRQGAEVVRPLAESTMRRVKMLTGLG